MAVAQADSALAANDSLRLAGPAFFSRKEVCHE
jgi:hypothetical protein